MFSHLLFLSHSHPSELRLLLSPPSSFVLAPVHIDADAPGRLEVWPFMLGVTLQAAAATCNCNCNASVNQTTLPGNTHTHTPRAPATPSPSPSQKPQTISRRGQKKKTPFFLFRRIANHTNTKQQTGALGASGLGPGAAQFTPNSNTNTTKPTEIKLGF